MSSLIWERSARARAGAARGYLPGLLQESERSMRRRAEIDSALRGSARRTGNGRSGLLGASGRDMPAAVARLGPSRRSLRAPALGSSSWDALVARVRVGCAASGPVCRRPDCALCWRYACLRYANLHRILNFFGMRCMAQC